MRKRGNIRRRSLHGRDKTSACLYGVIIKRSGPAPLRFSFTELQPGHRRLLNPNQRQSLTPPCHHLPSSNSYRSLLSHNGCVSSAQRSLPPDLIFPASATSEVITLNDPHSPTEKAFEAFEVVEHTIKSEILKSRHDWNKHEPRMWARAHGISNEDLVAFSIRTDLVEIRSAPVSYGTIILGKIRLPAVNDAEGEGYMHVRCVSVSARFAVLDAEEAAGRIHDPLERVHYVCTELCSADTDSFPRRA